MDEPWPTPYLPTSIPTSPSQIEKHHLLCSHPGYLLIVLVAQMPEGLWQQLDSVPINCLQSNANGHKLLMRQPRHFASLTYSSLSIFFKHKHTERSHTMPMCFLLTFFSSCSRGEINSQTTLCVFQNGRRQLSLVFQTGKGMKRGPENMNRVKLVRI